MHHYVLRRSGWNAGKGLVPLLHTRKTPSCGYGFVPGWSYSACRSSIKAKAVGKTRWCKSPENLSTKNTGASNECALMSRCLGVGNYKERKKKSTKPRVSKATCRYINDLGYLNNSLWIIVTQETWLILPVVICLFQGLSHASLRVNGLTVDLQTAH